MRIFGIRNGSASQADYHGGVDERYRLCRLQRGRGEARDAEHDDIERGFWHGKLPPPPEGFPHTPKMWWSCGEDYAESDAGQSRFTPRASSESACPVRGR